MSAENSSCFVWEGMAQAIQPVGKEFSVAQVGLCGLEGGLRLVPNCCGCSEESSYVEVRYRILVSFNMRLKQKCISLSSPDDVSKSRNGAKLPAVLFASQSMRDFYPLRIHACFAIIVHWPGSNSSCRCTCSLTRSCPGEPESH